jgi:hypothetical protein
MVYQNSPAERRLQEAIESLQKQVLALQQKPFMLPVLQDDPLQDTLINMWMLSDGRIRTRKPDGSIGEYSISTHTHPDAVANSQGGSTSTVTPPAPPPATKTYVGRWTQAWSASYRGLSGLPRRTDTTDLYYGRVGSVHGQQRSIIGFDGPAIRTAIGAGSITGVWIYINNKHTYPNGGTILRLGVHTHEAAPSSYSESTSGQGSIWVGKPSAKWTQIPNWFGAIIRTSANGIVFSQASDSIGKYGYAAPTVQLQIRYVK